MIAVDRRREVIDKKGGYMRAIQVTDKNLCIGCGNCMLVCSLMHEGECSIAMARIHVTKDLFLGQYEPEPCEQCENAQCLEACPIEGALTVDEVTGAKVIDHELCIGCRACEEACIFAPLKSRIRYDERKNVCVKCDLCGGEPECVKVCPVQILQYQP